MKTFWTILLVCFGGLAFIGLLLRNTALTHVFFVLGGLVAFWGIFIQMGPATVALYQRRRVKLTLQQMALEMAAQSDAELLDKFPKKFDLSEEQQRQLFPSALAMFPNGFQRSLEALDAARIELQKRNISIPPVDFQPLPFRQQKETRNLRQVLHWCIFTALFSIPLFLYITHHPAGGNLAATIIQIAVPILAILSTLGLVVIPCVLWMQYTLFRERHCKLAALSESIREASLSSSQSCREMQAINAASAPASQTDS